MGRLAAAVLFVLVISLGASSPAAAQGPYLRVATTGVGASVQIDPPGVLHGCSYAVCAYRYPAGTKVTLAATPSEAGSALATWAGACTGAAATCEVVVDATKTVAAQFSPVRLYADRWRGRGSVAVAPVGTPCGRACWVYAAGTAVTLTATPEPGWVFSHWAGLCSALTTANVCTATLVRDAQALPEFDCAGCRLGSWGRPGTRWALTTSGNGLVRINHRRCLRRTCQEVWTRGRQMSMRAYPPANGSFLGWAGRGCAGGALRCQFVLYRNLSGQAPVVIARFG